MLTYNERLADYSLTRIKDSTSAIGVSTDFVIFAQHRDIAS